jgi:type II restriction enzyme
MLTDLSAYFGKVAGHYKSKSQIMRIVSEKWFLDNMYCPACSESSIRQYPANSPVIDFFCESCDQQYQLKGKKNTIGKKILDGQFDTMMRAVHRNRLPSFAFFIYDPTRFIIKDLFFVPKYFFTASIIEKRKPLSVTARRAGYTGCNILFENIPEIAKIFAIKDTRIIHKNIVRDSWVKINFMADVKNSETRGWTSDILKCIDDIRGRIFRLEDCYRFESNLISLHPKNKNIRPKIRQQLQVLRDKGLIEFLGNGIYQKR